MNGRIAHGVLLLLVSVLGCRAAPEHTRGGETASARAADSVAAPLRVATDAALVIAVAPELERALHAAVDSFASREAVRITRVAASARDSAARGALRLDLVVVADETVLAPSTDSTGLASWYLPFARDRIVLAARDSAAVPGARPDSARWWRRTLLAKHVRVGRADPDTPLGARTLLAMRLAATNAKDSALATKLASASTVVGASDAADSLARALGGGALDFIWTYESAAERAGLRAIRLGREIDLGSESDSARYDSVTVRVPRASGDSATVRGAPIVYALTIPRDARDAATAARLVRFLLSEQGRAILRRDGLEPLARPVAVGRDLPASLAPAVDSVIASQAPDSLAPRVP